MNIIHRFKYRAYEKGYQQGEAEVVLGVAADIPIRDPDEDMWFLGYQSAKDKKIQMSPRQFQTYYDMNHKTNAADGFSVGKVVFG